MAEIVSRLALPPGALPFHVRRPFAKESGVSSAGGRGGHGIGHEVLAVMAVLGVLDAPPSDSAESETRHSTEKRSPWSRLSPGRTSGPFLLINW
jgi:hypothetical protein